MGDPDKGVSTKNDAGSDDAGSDAGGDRTEGTDLPRPVPRPVDRRSPVPLWAQVLDDLRRRAASGAWAEAVPTDAELMADYDVSRQTVREAMRRLVAEGVVERQRGRGSRLRQPEFAQPLGSLYSLFREIEARGVAQTSQVLTLDERVDGPVATQLGLRATAPLVFLERLRLAGDRPLALDQAWLPAEVARPLLEADFGRTALYDELARRCGVQPDRGWEQVRPMVPTPDQRRLLAVARGEAVFVVERRTWAGELPLEVRHTVVRGDRYALVAQWEPGLATPEAGTPPVLRLLPVAAGAGTTPD
jgi:GntR family transcriptional regulator